MFPMIPAELDDALALLAPAALLTVVLVVVHAQFGLHVLRRNVVFVDLALAQTAALGATLAFSLGHAPTSVAAWGWSLGFALGGALVLSALRAAPARVPHEALIGMLYVGTAAASVLLIERAPQGAEHLRQLLTGNVVTTEFTDVRALLPTYTAVSALVALAAKRGWFDRTGLAGWAADLLFYAAFAVVVTSSVAVAGVLLVFAILIVPAAAARWLSPWTGFEWPVATGFGVGAGWLGLAASYVLDLPSGAAMVVTIVLGFVAVVMAAGAWRHARGRTLRRPARALLQLLAVVLLASGLWAGVAPTADHPLLDAAEAVAPGMRTLYLRDAELATIVDSQAYAERLRAMADALNAREAASRDSSAPMDDAEVARLSSLVKTYNEMLKGEQFVAAQVIDLGRTRARWALAAAFGTLALGAALAARLLARRKCPVEEHVPGGHVLGGATG